MRSTFRPALRSALVTIGFIGASVPAMACNTDPYIGTTCIFAFDWCPRDYLPADGRSLNINQFTALFALIGFTYGGDNVSNFKLPDLRGRVAVGTGAGPNLTPVSIAQTFGQQSLVLTAAQTPLVPHTHPSTFTPTQGTQTINIPASTGGAGVSVNATAVDRSSPTTPSVTGGSIIYPTNAGSYAGATNQLKGLYTATAPGGDNKATMPVTGNPAFSFDLTAVNGGTVTVTNAGAPASQPVPTQPPSLGMTACIAVQGLYPNRP